VKERVRAESTSAAVERAPATAGKRGTMGGVSMSRDGSALQGQTGKGRDRVQFNAKKGGHSEENKMGGRN